MHDNGDNNFDYIIVCPYTFDTESGDTLYQKRQPLGNNIPAGMFAYKRDERDADGRQYDAEAIDDENFTLRVYDATGWPSTPLFGSAPVNKGSATKPTTVIVTGEFLKLGNGPVRSYFTQATLKSIAEAVAK